MKRIMAQSKSLTIQQAFDEFINEKRLKNLAIDSIIHYERCLKNFYRFIDPKTEIVSICKETIADYIGFMNQKTLKPSTININLGFVRVFLYYCMENDYLRNFKINLIKADETPKSTYSEEELLVLLIKPNTDKFNEIRNWVIINFAVSTGARVNTIRNLQIGDIDFENKSVYFRKVKNRKPKILPLGDSMLMIFKKYIRTYFPDSSIDSYLFPSCYGNAMSTISMEQVIKLHNTKYGVTTSSMHAFRRTYAKLFIKNHGSIEQLKEYMQHSSISMTEKYFKLYADDLRQDYERYNPLEQLLAQYKKGTYIKAKT